MGLKGAVAIAVIQHGDYEAALRTIADGHGEPYFGMTHSVEVLEGLFRGRRHVVISLCPRSYRVRRGEGLLLGIPEPSSPPLLPRSLAAARRSHTILRELRAFAPTHLLLRTTGLPAWRILEYCVSHRVSTLAVFASVFDPGRRWWNRAMTHRVVRLLNDPTVHRVGNHRRPAAESLIEVGVQPSKVVAFDWPNLRSPEDYPPKREPVGASRTILYVGSMVASKGLGDLIEAVRILRGNGTDVRLVCAGAGPELEHFRRQARSIDGSAVEFLGLVPNEKAFRLMREADLVCVPSRYEYPEGMPFALTEALASRTPLVASDHPVLKRAFTDGEGVSFFRAGSATDLADRIQGALSDPVLYERLSKTALAAFSRVHVPMTFGALVSDWYRTFPEACM